MYVMTNFKQPVKLTKCKICRTEYRKWSISQKVCSNPDCAIALVELDKAKKQRQADKARRIELKSKREWLKDTQAVFNSYIRKRDHGQPCISCGTTASIQYCAGHYRTVGACPELRFEPLNVHLQCNKNCNMEKSGNIVLYRIELIKKIGIDKVEWLEGTHKPKKWTVDDLKEIIKTYKQLTKDLA